LAAQISSMKNSKCACGSQCQCENCNCDEPEQVTHAMRVANSAFEDIYDGLINMTKEELCEFMIGKCKKYKAAIEKDKLVNKVATQLEVLWEEALEIVEARLQARLRSKDKTITLANAGCGAQHKVDEEVKRQVQSSLTPYLEELGNAIKTVDEWKDHKLDKLMSVVDIDDEMASTNY
jgi:hypothetical protein